MPTSPRKDASGYNPQVPAIDQTMRVLYYLSAAASPGKSLTEICRHAGIHKSRGYALLGTLQKYDLVAREPITKTYSLGPGLLPLAKKFLDHLDIRRLSRPVLEKLSRETGSTALLGHVNGEFVFVIAGSQAERELGVSIRIGHRFDLTHGAHGKAILAFTPEDERRRILDSEPLYFYGQTGKTDLARLEEELKRCRQSGYAFDLGELQPGIKAISAPIAGPGGRMTGCVILVGIFNANKIEHYGPLVVEAARKIEHSTGGPF